MRISHDVIVAAVKAYNPSLTYRERRLLEERRYQDLLALVRRAIRDAKWMLIAWPLIGLLQVFLHGYNIVGGFLRDGDVSGALRGGGILVVVGFLAAAIVVWTGVSRLVVLERAKLVLELAVDQAGALGQTDEMEEAGAWRHAGLDTASPAIDQYGPKRGCDERYASSLAR